MTNSDRLGVGGGEGWGSVHVAVTDVTRNLDVGKNLAVVLLTRYVTGGKNILAYPVTHME